VVEEMVEARWEEEEVEVVVGEEVEVAEEKEEASEDRKLTLYRKLMLTLFTTKISGYDRTVSSRHVVVHRYRKLPPF
jgi:hypothetical protein